MPSAIRLSKKRKYLLAMAPKRLF